jgi:UTP-glucose-1-phosphate uridylyltransferase
MIIVKLDKDNNLVDLVEKNEDNSSCEIHGRMLLNKRIFDVKDLLFKHDNDEYFLPYALLKFKGQVKTLKYQGEYFNLGEKTG